VVILLILKFVPGNEPDGSAVPVSTLSTIQPWQPFLDDDLPILLVIGDYYIFGEVDESGNILRMVREFDINSRGELTRFQQRQPEIASNYYNLDLSYIPVSIANAMVRLVPVLGSKADQLSVKMMSELETAELANNHLIYLGYLSGVDTLLDLMFADSGLSIGATYDELINLETNEYYIGSSGLSGDENFQDYGMVSTFPAPNGNHFLLIAGMRDEGLVNIAQQMTSPESLAILMDTFRGETPVSFEALYEVFGFDNTNFGGELVYSRSLDTQVIWEARLIKN
jgi:hypothetical protein